MQWAALALALNEIPCSEFFCKIGISLVESCRRSGCLLYFLGSEVELHSDVHSSSSKNGTRSKTRPSKDQDDVWWSPTYRFAFYLQLRDVSEDIGVRLMKWSHESLFSFKLSSPRRERHGRHDPVSTCH